MEFTASQRRAIAHHLGNVQLIACAGSGKTEVVARRVARLLGAGGLLPRNIVAFTFTEKAAAELKERIVTRCREELGEVTGLAELYVGTIHAFALELLKSEVHEFLRYEVLNEVQQTLLVDRYSKQSGLTTSADLKGVRLKRYRDTSNYIAGLSILREADLNAAALAGCTLVDGLASYRKLFRERSYFDYSSILDAAVNVLKTDAGARDRISKRVKCVIVDEYQDVNPVQERLVRELHDLGARLCVVGDDDQTIYQWRGSDVRNIVRFADRYPDVEQVRLEENFRSSTGVVETARAFIAQNVERLSKEMKPTSAQTDEVGDIAALGFADPDEEADYIAKTLRELRGVAIRDTHGDRGISWSDMAILFRSVAKNAAPITQALQRAGIPYVVVGMNRLFDTAEANACRQLFYFMSNRANEREVLDAWVAANAGATVADLKRALRNAEDARDAMAREDVPKYGVYNIQRQFLQFLEDARIREERVPAGAMPNRGEIVFYNLGKFSQLISDFETIHFKSKPVEKYASFADFLFYGVEDAYPEGWQSNQYANPDAVRIMTVHQSKGMQWPVVFLPALLRNRFPSKRHGGRNVWHLLPAAAVKNHDRYLGNVEDERRLFYVAMTRSQKFLFMTYAPIAGNRLYQLNSEFIDDVRASKWVKRRPQDYSSRARLEPTPKASVSNVVLTFSDMKYFFECPYQFKLRILYGFNAPLREALGYGKSLHDALAEVHARAIQGDVATTAEVPSLVDRHLHVPYAYDVLRDKLAKAAEDVLRRYIRDNQKDFSKIEFSEKSIELHLGNGVSVVGRIDLVRRLDTNEVSIIDLKSKERVQSEEVNETQLHIYAMGYKELTGRSADYVDVYDLDVGKPKRRSVDESFMDDVKKNIHVVAAALRSSNMPAKPSAPTRACTQCDYLHMCSAGLKNVGK